MSASDIGEWDVECGMMEILHSFYATFLYLAPGDIMDMKPINSTANLRLRLTSSSASRSSLESLTCLIR